MDVHRKIFIENCCLKLEGLKAPYLFAIAENGKVTESISSKDHEEPGSLTFPIYSVTKIFIGTLILKLVEKGILGLGDKLGKHIDNFHAEWLKSLTLESLLSHRSGLGDYGYIEEYKKGVAATPSHKVDDNYLISLAVDQGPKFTQGDQFLYSNIGYLYLKKIIEKYFDANFGDVLQKQIVTPLSLDNTRVAVTQEDFRSVLFDTESSDSIGGGDARQKYHPAWVSHGLIISNIYDLALFFDAVFRGKFLSESLKRLLREPKQLDFPGKILKPHYGFGIMGDPNSSIGSVLGHDGGGPGYSVSAFHQKYGELQRDLFLVLGKEGIQGIDILASMLSKRRAEKI